VITGLGAAALGLVLVAPGALMVMGYRRARFLGRSVPDEHGLYVIAQALVASAIWLAVVWLLLLALGDPLEAWGAVPLRTSELQNHRSDIVWLGLVIAAAPFWVGVIAARFVNRLTLNPSGRAFRLAVRTGLVPRPSAWDRAWSRYIARQGAGEVVVRLKDGLMIHGGFGLEAQVDISPNPSQLYLASGYGYVSDESGELVEVGAYGDEGVFVAGSEIEAVYFKSRSTGRDASDTDPIGGETPSRLANGHDDPPRPPSSPASGQGRSAAGSQSA